MEPEICRKMLKKLSEKLGAKFPATTHGYSMVKFACLDDPFLEAFFNCKQAQQKANHCSKKKRKGEKGTKIKKPKDDCNFDFCTCPSQNVVKYNASSKKGKLLGCKCLFDEIKGNLVEILREMSKNAFLAKSSGTQWVKVPISSKFLFSHLILRFMQ